MNKITLPIEKHPEIRTYMGDVGVFSIMEPEIKNSSDFIISDITVKNSEIELKKPTIKFETNRINVMAKEQEYLLTSNPHIQTKWAKVNWTDYVGNGDFELEFGVVFLKKLDLIKQMTLFVTSNYYLELYSNGAVNLYENGKKILNGFINNNFAGNKIFFKICYSNQILRLFYKNEKNKYVELSEKSCVREDLNLSMEFIPAFHPMHNILYNNYIQLVMDTSGDSINSLNYCNGIGLFKVFDNVLKIFEVDHKLVKQQYGSYVNFIKSILSSGLYLWLGVDEYYIPERPAYRKHHFVHPNLAHAFDDEKKHIEILGYNFTLNSNAVSFDDIEKSCCSEYVKHAYYNDLIIFRKNERCYPEPLNIKFIIKTLEEYKYGCDTGFLYGNVEGYHLLNNPIYGLDIYKAILENDSLLENFIHDRRYAYILLEHKNIMLKRITYFCDNGILKDDKCKEIYDKYSILYTMGQVLCNLIVKNRIRANENTAIKARNLLKEMLEIEKIAIDQLLNVLKAVKL